MVVTCKPAAQVLTPPGKRLREINEAMRSDGAKEASPFEKYGGKTHRI